VRHKTLVYFSSYSNDFTVVILMRKTKNRGTDAINCDICCSDEKFLQNFCKQN